MLKMIRRKKELKKKENLKRWYSCMWLILTTDLKIAVILWPAQKERKPTDGWLCIDAFKFMQFWPFSTFFFRKKTKKLKWTSNHFFFVSLSIKYSTVEEFKFFVLKILVDSNEIEKKCEIIFEPNEHFQTADRYRTILTFSDSLFSPDYSIHRIKI